MNLLPKWYFDEDSVLDGLNGLVEAPYDEDGPEGVSRAQYVAIIPRVREVNGGEGPGPRTDEEVIALGRLIASVPELLIVLSQAIDLYTNLSNWGDNTKDSDLTTDGELTLESMVRLYERLRPLI